MNAGRYAQSSTLLSSGNVLIAGGCSAGSDCLATAQVYNPTTGQFTSTGTMTTKRWGQTATLMANGLVLITGGCTGGGSCLSSAEVYNPSTGTFSLTGNNMSVERYSHQATLLNSGLVLITGGCASSSNCDNEADLYDPNTSKFTATGSMESKRYDHTATLLSTGNVLIAGGCTGNGSCLDTAELYNPVSGTFSSTGNMTSARYTHTATPIGGGDILITGGCTGNGSCLASAELYNPTAGTFALTGSMTTARYSHAAANLFDGTVLISGGCTGNGACLSSAELYSPTSKSFVLTGSMSAKRYSDTATLLVDGSVVTAGGCTGGGSCLATVDLYKGPAPDYGYVSPKYMILSVQYAPPGSKSSVTYADSTVLGASTTFSSSFTNAQTESISWAWTAGTILGVLGNSPSVSLSATFTTGYSQETDSSNSISINTTSSYSNGVPGPSSDYSGIDHTKDLITIWLNPVQLWGTLPNNPDTLQLLTNSYDLIDPVSAASGQIDVVTLSVEQLENPGTDIDPQTLKLLTRFWAFNLEDGTSPGLTTADYTDILKADPFSNPSYVPVFNPTTHCSTDGRYCASTAENGTGDIQYMQPGPGQQPEPMSWGQGFQIIASQNAGYKDTHTVGYSLDINLTDGFLSNWESSKVTLKDSDKLTWVNSYSATSTNTTNQTATINITGPACVVPAGSSTCNPVYTGPTAIDLFEDTVYRTFMFFAPE